MVWPMARWLLVLTLLLAACGGDDSESSSTTSGPPTVGLDTDNPTLPDKPGTEATGTPTGTPTDSSTGPSATRPAATTTTEDDGPPVVLEGDGLGAEPFGAPVDEVIAALTLRWAPPDEDSGWIPAGSSPYGVCPGNEVRVVEWRGFRVYFSDGPTPHGPAGKRHFFSWQYLAADLDHPAPDQGGNRPVLKTAESISVGASVPALQKAYGDKLELFDEEAGGGPFFGVQLPDGGIFGSLTTIEPSGVVRSMTGGGGCGE